MESGRDEEQDSGDYTKYGITDVPKTTVKTVFGKTKTFVGLSWKESAFLALTTLNILAAVALTIYRLVVVIRDNQAESPDFTFTILLLINAVFVSFYAFHGVLRERKYELYVLTLAVLVILLYCIVEYGINSEGRSTVKLVRLILACILAPPNIILAIVVARLFGELEFRIAGASEFLQYIYNQAAIFSCWLKFDLQVTASFVLLALKEGVKLDTLEIVTLAVGIPYTLLWDIFGWIVLRQELRRCAWLFAALGLVKPAYYIYKIVKLYQTLHDESEENPDKIIVYCLLVAGALAMLAWLIIMMELVVVYRNFGKGLKEKAAFNVMTERTSLLTGRRT